MPEQRFCTSHFDLVFYCGTHHMFRHCLDKMSTVWFYEGIWLQCTAHPQPICRVAKFQQAKMVNTIHELISMLTYKFQTCQLKCLLSDLKTHLGS